MSRPMLSVIVPAHDEEENLEATIVALARTIEAADVPYEILVVNDNSTDGTQAVAEGLAARFPTVRVLQRLRLGGFGRAVREGLAAYRGDVVVIVMADSSDDPDDVVRYYRKIEEGYDCVFGSRWRPGSVVVDYPWGKRVVNRLVNKLIQVMFWTRMNDLTNAFKAYRREVIDACGPYSSSHFNLTIEMSLSALIRRYQIAEIPIRWYGRTWGASKLSIYEMGRRYLSVLLKLFFDRLLVSDDILEERLAARARNDPRIEEIERRLERVEAACKTDDPA